MTQADRARALAALHVPGQPLILFNVWDPGSARAVAKGGARAIATGSWSVAAAFGYPDGEQVPLDTALENLARIARAVDLPVTLDFEGAYADDPAGAGANAARALAAGAVGFNIEDQIVGTDRLHDAAAQGARLAAIRAACDAAGIPAFLNARTDLFLKAKPEVHAGLIDEALARAGAYAAAGASGFFAPGLADEALIGRLCAAAPLPVNIMLLPGAPAPARLAALGAARISHGPFPYRAMAKWLEGEARAAHAAAG